MFGGVFKRLTVLSIAAVSTVLLSTVGYTVYGGALDPPSISFSSPAGAEVLPTTPATVVFDRWMDHASAEKAFRIDPPTAGSFQWEGNTMRFVPKDGWAHGVTYKVSIGPEAQSFFRQGLRSPVSFEFVAAGPFAVKSVQPVAGAGEVAVDTSVFVQFNHPVVALGTLANQPDLNPLSITPPIDGKGKWLNTSTYLLRPAQPLNPATHYEVTIKKGLKDTTASELGDDYRWSFTTTAPAVGDTSPGADSKFAPINGAIDVIFNQAMDKGSAESRFELREDGGGKVTGTISWSDSLTMTFKPASPLKPGTDYTGKVAAGALGVSQQAGMAADFVWHFTTAPKPQVVATNPANGQGTANQPVWIGFSSPMDIDALQKNVVVEPKLDNLQTNLSENDTKLFLYGPFKPSTRYTISVAAGTPSRDGQVLAQPFSFSFTTAPLPPTVRLVTKGSVGAFSAYLSPEVYVNYVNVSRLDWAVYPLDEATFLSLSQNSEALRQYKPNQPAVRQWSSTKLDAGQNVPGLVSSTVGGDNQHLAAGYYFLQVAAPEGSQDRQLMMVSKASLTLKRSDQEILVWAVDQSTGKPVPNLALRVLDPSGKEVATGKTDADGIYQGAVPAANQGKGGINTNLYVIGRGDADTVMASTTWNSGIESWAFNLPYQVGIPAYKGEVYTDRPIYRAGQNVCYKGNLRADDDGKYSLPPAGTKVALTFFDGSNRQVLTTTVPLNEFGSFDGEFSIAPEAALGTYRINAQIGDGPIATYFGTSFLVAEYRKPEFQVSVTTERKDYVQGDRIVATLQANYFFGGPVANSAVTWRVTSGDYIFQLPEGKWYNFYDSDLMENRKPSNGLRAQGSGVTDADGKFTFGVPVDLTADPVSQIFTVEASVQDTSNQEVSNRTDVRAHKSALYLGVRPTRYIGKSGESQSVELVAVDPAGKPMPATNVVATILLRKWSTVQEKLSDGGSRWVSTHEDTEVGKQNTATDASGKATISFTPQSGGEYRVVVRAKDAAGNEARSATGLYVSGAQYVGWQVDNNDRLQLVSDKKQYEVGETAKVLVPSPFGKSEALVTIERGHVISRRVVEFNTNSPVVEVPIEAGYVPNVYVSVVLVSVPDASSPPSFRLGYAELSVSTADKQLNVSITPDKTQYEPQDTAVYNVKVTDRAGKPVQAELSFALVDAAVLSLADDRTQPALDVFYGRRPIGVASASTLAVSMDRLSAQMTVMGKGGDGMTNAGPSVRADFRDTAYWNATVRTDANGLAKVSIKLPDNLTTWRARVRGITGDTLVGGVENDIVTSKGLLVRPVTPRFFTTGDEADLQAIVQNSGTAPVEVEVSLEGKNIAPRGAGSNKVYKITVPAGGNQKVTWPVKVGQAGTASLTFTAKPTSGAVKPDAVSLDLPVKPLATAEVVATAGEVTDQVTEKVSIPASLDRSQGDLTVEVAPSLAAGMRYSAQFLEGYPYECTEQTVSRFLPRIVMSRAFSKLGLPDKDGLAADLPPLVNRSLQRLYQGQHADGGWGWWSNDQSDPWMTAYVVLGMAEAKQSGFTVDASALKRAQDFLTRYLSTKPDAQNENLDLRAFVLYTMARSGQGDVGLVNSLYDRRQGLGVYGRAYLAVAMANLGADPKADSKLQSLLSDLVGSAKVSAEAAHWEEDTIDYWSLNTNTRSTAIVLDALVRLAPDNALVQQTVRWLMVARKEGHWETTQDTAWSLLALTDYLAASGELNADYSYAVTVNGKPLGGGKVTKDNVDQVNTLVEELKDLLTGDNNVVLGRLRPEQGQTGKGKMYYTMQLKYYQASDQVAADAQGVYVFREYLSADGKDTDLTSAKAGDLVKVRLTIVAPEDMHYLIVEDPIPAGTEAVDTRLKTTSLAAQDQTGGIIKTQQGIKYPTWVPPDQLRKAWYFNQIQVQDDQVAVFATYLPRGTYEYTYLLRATTPGRYQAQPARASEMYFPEVWGRSAGNQFTVGE